MPGPVPDRVRDLDMQVVAGRRVEARGGSFDSTAACAAGAKRIADFARRSAKFADFMTL
jgi:hypothetical protein